MKKLTATAFAWLACAASQALAQSVTTVENLGTIPSTQINSGLGFNLVNSNSLTEIQLAAQAGAVQVRFQPGWENTQAMNGSYSLGAGETTLDWCYENGLQPLVISAYGPPYQKILTLTVASAVPSGSHVIPVTTSVASINPPYCHVMETGNVQITPAGKWGYYGALIDSVNTTNNTITLACATDVALPANTSLIVNQLLYPSCASGGSVSEPSIVAYGNYCEFLAGRIAAQTTNRPNGLTGRVEIWNEPPWTHDPWDDRAAFYDGTLPNGVASGSSIFGWAALLKGQTPPGQARFDWGGTDKTGGNSLLGSRMVSPLTSAQQAASMSTESFHPYTDAPEESSWDPTTLAAQTSSGAAFNATLTGGSWGSNFKQARWLAVNNLKVYGWTVGQNITETGMYTTDEVAKARYTLRHFLTDQADGYDRVNFFTLAGPSVAGTPDYYFVNTSTATPTPYQAYLAIQGLMQQAAPLSTAPVTVNPGDLPTVTSYHGYYPLTTAAIVGRRSSTATKNAVLYAAWQRSYVPPVPTSLAAVPANNQVTLNWDDGTGANPPLYNVKRATVSGGPYTVVGTFQSAAYNIGCTFKDTGVVNGTKYFYVVNSSNSVGTSGNSAELSVVAGAGGAVTLNTHAADAVASWASLASPAAVPVTLQIPTGFSAIAAWNANSLAAVPLTYAGSNVTYQVADDPVIVQVEPAYYNVQFNADAVNTTPATAAYVAGTTDTEPSSLSLGSNDLATVESSYGGLTNKPVELQSLGTANYQPKVYCGLPGVTAGKLEIEWDASVSSFTGSTGAETLLTQQVIGSSGAALAVCFTKTSTSGGTINIQLAGGQDSSPAWSFNTPIHFLLSLDLDAGTYTAYANGVAFATAKAATFGTVEGFSIQDGGALGGRNGDSFTAAVDNIAIYP